MPQPKRVEVQVQGRTLSLSNLDKVLYPAAGFTKGQVIDYYTRVAPYVLPHLEGRALTLKRYPNGVEAQYFYEKNAPSHRPDWVNTATIPIRTDGRTIDFVLADDLPTLVWLANLADLELHTSLAKASDPGAPTILAFDLDPGPGADLDDCAQVALSVRELLEDIGLHPVPLTSGSKGIHLYARLDGRQTSAQVSDVAHELARAVEADHPDLVLSTMGKADRRGKVLLDWSQNHPAKTTITPYSLRGKDRPTVAAPRRWEEVTAGIAQLAPAEVVRRLEADGDLLADLS